MKLGTHIRYRGISFMREREVGVIIANDTRTEKDLPVVSPNTSAPSLGAMTTEDTDATLQDGWTPVKRPLSALLPQPQMVIGKVTEGRAIGAVGEVTLGKLRLTIAAPMKASRLVLFEENGATPVSTIPAHQTESIPVETISLRQLRRTFTREQSKRGLSTAGSLHRQAKVRFDAYERARRNGADLSYRVPKTSQGGWKLHTGVHQEPSQPVDPKRLVSDDGVTW